MYSPHCKDYGKYNFSIVCNIVQTWNIIDGQTNGKFVKEAYVHVTCETRTKLSFLIDKNKGWH